jgi:lysophospholipase L1-like esterase
MPWPRWSPCPWMLIFVGVFASPALAGRPPESVVRGGDRVVFLGDSITHAGHYVSYIEAHLRVQLGGEPVEVINLGLPSENCTGLSEPDHPFPRPNVHERLARVLAKTKPDVVIACYGMNDGIYYPFDAQRFAQYQDGIRRLAAKVHESGARLVLLTPPAFDPLPMRRQGKLRPAGAEKFAWFAAYENYDDVMQRYAEWVLGHKDLAETVIDIHGPIQQYLAEKREADPDFAMSDDGVHVNLEGHRVIARAVVAGFGLQWNEHLDPKLFRAIETKRAIMHPAWLTHVGHTRPGVEAGLPLEDARAKAAELETRIRTLAAAAK